MKLRRANASDASRIRSVHLRAFGDEEKQLVANLACELLSEASSPESVHLVAEEADRLLGHVAFSPLHSRRNGGFIGYILAPLAVAPSHQGMGIGKELVKQGLSDLARRQVERILVYGDPKFYSRFGFRTELASKYVPPFPLRHPHGWQAIDTAAKEFPSAPEPIQCVKALNNPALW